MAAVLLIENDVPIVRLMAWYLIDAGFEVSKAATPAEASERLLRRAPSEGAVIVFNTGIAAAERKAWIQNWHDQNPCFQVLDVTESEAARHLPNVGADASIRLPFEAETFVTMVGELMAASNENKRA